MPNFYFRITAKSSSDAQPASALKFFQNPLSAWQSFAMPLSGAVTQAINLWSWTTGQIGLVNVNHGRSCNPEVEQINAGYRPTKKVTKRA